MYHEKYKICILRAKFAKKVAVVFYYKLFSISTAKKNIATEDTVFLMNKCTTHSSNCCKIHLY